jgi:hypothetical protein
MRPLPRCRRWFLASLLGACSTIGEPPHDWLLLPTAAVVALDNGYLKIPALAAGGRVCPGGPAGPQLDHAGGPWVRSVTASCCA